MKLVVVASSKLWPAPELVASLASLIASLPRGSEVWVRGTENGLVYGPTSPLEKAAHELAGRMGFYCSWASPGWGPSRDTVFARDYRLVGDADRVVGFFMEDEPMGGGAGHVVHAALQKGVPCEAWMWTDDGLVNVGSDGDEIEDLDNRSIDAVYPYHSIVWNADWAPTGSP